MRLNGWKLIAVIAIATIAIAPRPIHWMMQYAGSHHHKLLIDFTDFWTAGESILLGRPIYSTLIQFFPPDFMAFNYPPFAAVLMVPVALLPPPLSGWMWLMAVVLPCLVITVLLAFRDLRARLGVWTPLIVVVMAYLGPMVDLVRLGQIGTLLAALCVADCLTKSPRWPRGLLVGIATATKLVPGVFVVYLWLSGRRKAAVTAGITVALATVGPFLLLPKDSVDFWFGQLVGFGQKESARLDNQSLLGMFLRLHLPGPITTALWLASAAFVAYAGLRAARQFSLAGAEVTGVAIVGLVSALVSPIAWNHHFVWIIVVLAALIGDGRDTVRNAVAAMVCVFYLGPPRLNHWPVRALESLGVPPSLATASYGIGGLVTLAILIWWLPRRTAGYTRDSSDRPAGRPVRTLEMVAP